MTKREFFENVAKNEITDEMMTFAAGEIAKMDMENSRNAAKRAEKSAAKAAEDAPVIAAIEGAITNDPKTAAEILAETGLDVSAQKVARVLKTGVDAGRFEKTSKRVEGKKAPVVAYQLA